MPLTPGTADVLTTPLAPTVVQNTVGAGVSITYSIAWVNAAGQDSIPSPAIVTPANNASPANNTISWVLAPGVVQTRVLKNGNLLTTVGSGVTSFTDSAGAAGVAYAASTANPAAMAPSANAPTDGQKWTYSAQVTGLAPVTASTDIVNLLVSTSKLVRITRVIFGGSLTTAANIDVQLTKRSTVTTAGTSMPAVPYDSNAPASTVVCSSYTANPASLGTAIGIVAAARYNCPTPTTGFGPPMILDFGNRPAGAIVLRPAATALQNLGIGINGLVTVTGGTFDITVEWTEE